MFNIVFFFSFTEANTRSLTLNKKGCISNAMTISQTGFFYHVPVPKLYYGGSSPCRKSPKIQQIRLSSHSEKVWIYTLV